MYEAEPDILNLDIHQKKTYDEILSPEAKSCLKTADNNFGYDPDKNEAPLLVGPVYPLRVFGVLSLMIARSEIEGHGLKNGFSAAEVQRRHQKNNNVGDYSKALKLLVKAGLVVADDGRGPTRYYLHPKVSLGPVFEDASTRDLDKIVVANEETATSPNYIATLLPGMGDLMEAAGNDQLFERPLASGKAGLSVGVVLSLGAVLQFATPGVTPGVDFLMATWLILSVGIAATCGGFVQGCNLWLHNKFTA